MKKCIIFLISILFITSCTILNSSVKKNSFKENKNYIGFGESYSLLEAIYKAKISTIQRAVIDIIGIYSEQKNKDKLNKLLYHTQSCNYYVENEKMHIIKKYKMGKTYFCEIQIPVKLPELVDFLTSIQVEYEEKDNNIDEQNIQTNKTNEYFLSSAKSIANDNENAKYVDQYLQTMTYMVFGYDKSTIDQFLLKSSIQMANSYLINKGYRVVDYTQIEKLKKDNALVFEESENEAVSAIQWIAQKLNADVYLEIDGSTEGGYEYDGYYGSAKITIKIFNPSTGELLGSVPYSSPKTFSKLSAYDAQSNALQSTVYKVLPIVEDQSKIMLAKTYLDGIRYELIINGNNDIRLLSAFKKLLSSKVNMIKTLNVSRKQTKYAIFHFSDIDDVIDIIYSVADSIPGLQDMELVMCRGKSIIFTIGM